MKRFLYTVKNTNKYNTIQIKEKLFIHNYWLSLKKNIQRFATLINHRLWPEYDFNDEKDI